MAPSRTKPSSALPLELCTIVADLVASRVHRYGQDRDVYVIRFIVRDSVERRMLALQEKKRAIINGALAGSDGQSKKQMLENLEVRHLPVSRPGSSADRSVQTIFAD